MSIPASLQVLSQTDSRLYRVKIRALNNLVNANGWQYENLEGHLGRFTRVPILTAYVNGGRTVGDGHNYALRRDERTGEEYISFTDAEAERIVGFVPSEPHPRIVREEGTDWVELTGYIWRWYARELIEQISRGGGMAVSIETLVSSSRRENDIDVEEKWDVLGITVLGNGVSPAVKGAKIQHNRKKRGVKRLITEKHLKELGSRYAGYTCVGADSEEKALALLDEGCRLFICCTEGSSEVPELRAAETELTVRCGEDTVFTADLELILEAASARCEALEKTATGLKEDKARLEQELDGMKNAERLRRRRDAARAAEDELARLNANRGPERLFAHELIDPLLESINSDGYSDTTDAEGAWCGEADVKALVDGICMRAQADMDAEDMLRRKRCYSWTDCGATAPGAVRTVADRLREKN